MQGELRAVIRYQGLKLAKGIGFNIPESSNHSLRMLIRQFANNDVFQCVIYNDQQELLLVFAKNSVNLEVARFLFESGFSWAMLNATVMNRAWFEIFGIVPVTFSLIRKLLI